jgi:hypothetical protein
MLLFCQKDEFFDTTMFTATLTGSAWKIEEFGKGIYVENHYRYLSSNH